MELQNNNITKRTAHYTETQYIHCTHDTEELPKQSRGRTRAPSPYGTTALQKELHITETQYIHCTYDTKEPPNQSHGRTREPSP